MVPYLHTKMRQLRFVDHEPLARKRGPNVSYRLKSAFKSKPMGMATAGVFFSGIAFGQIRSLLPVPTPTPQVVVTPPLLIANTFAEIQACQGMENSRLSGVTGLRKHR